MNEQINGLWWKARIGYNNQSCDPEVLGKFAELIVQECVSTVEGMSPGYQDYRNQIEDAFRRDCVIEIKHKFGVEE